VTLTDATHIMYPITFKKALITKRHVDTQVGERQPTKESTMTTGLRTQNYTPKPTNNDNK